MEFRNDDGCSLYYKGVRLRAVGNQNMENREQEKSDNTKLQTSNSILFCLQFLVSINPFHLEKKRAQFSSDSSKIYYYEVFISNVLKESFPLICKNQNGFLHYENHDLRHL